MKSFRITKKIVVAAGMLAFCFWQFDAFGSAINVLDGEIGMSIVRVPTPCPAPLNSLPKDLQELIFNKVLENNPRHLLRISKDWYKFIREQENISDGTELRYLINMNPFMKACMQTYWENAFYNGVLRYTSTNDGPVVELKFLDLKNKDQKGTFDLSACGNTGDHLVITINPDRFCEIEGANKDKTVTAIVPYHWIKKITESNTDHPLASLMAGWDPDIAPIGMFWRYGNLTDLTRVDSLTNARMSVISGCNLFELWAGHARFRGGGVLAGSYVSCQFLNRNKD
jgi:hypothetical protein